MLGCVVLIGVEVIFNGVLFFCELKLKNVVMMLVMFGGIVVLMFMGIFVLVSVIGVKMFDEMGELYFVDMYGGLRVKKCVWNCGFLWIDL